MRSRETIEEENKRTYSTEALLNLLLEVALDCRDLLLTPPTDK